MNPEKSRHGGQRKGAGRPKKKTGDLQKTHSLRATDKDWKEIQAAARIIKVCDNIRKRPRVFMLDDDELASVSRFLLGELLEKHQMAKYGKPEPPSALQQTTITGPEDRQIPETASEEDAVSVFLEYFRLNPVEAMSVIQTKLEHEKRIREIKRLRDEQAEAIDRLDKETANKLKSVDEINARVARMLQFSNFSK